MDFFYTFFLSQVWGGVLKRADAPEDPRAATAAVPDSAEVLQQPKLAKTSMTISRLMRKEPKSPRTPKKSAGKGTLPEGVPEAEEPMLKSKEKLMTTIMHYVELKLKQQSEQYAYYMEEVAKRWPDDAQDVESAFQVSPQNCHIGLINLNLKNYGTIMKNQKYAEKFCSIFRVYRKKNSKSIFKEKNFHNEFSFKKIIGLARERLNANFPK